MSIDAVELINQNIDAVKILEYYNFESISQRGNYIRSACAIHGGKDPTAFVFNLDNKLWYCHTGCNKGGDVYDLIMNMESVSFTESVRIASQIFNVDIEGIEIKERPAKWLLETKKWIQSMKKRNKNKNKKELHLDDYVMYDLKKFRDFDNNTLLRFGLKYIESFEYEKDDKKVVLKNRLLYPVYFNKKLVMILLRVVNKNDIPKWFNYPPSIDSGDILYNYDNAVEYMKENNIRDIIVVEGVHDVWRYYEAGIENVVGTFGAHLTKTQSDLICQVAEGLYISYDNDKAGILATNKAIEELKYKMNLKIVELEENKDPAEHTTEELIEKFNNAIHHKEWGTKYGQIIRTIKNAKKSKRMD